MHPDNRKEALKYAITEDLRYSKGKILLSKNNFEMMNKEDYNNLRLIIHNREECTLKTKFAQNLLTELFESDYQVTLTGRVVFIYTGANFVYHVMLNGRVYSIQYKTFKFNKPMRKPYARKRLKQLIKFINNKYIQWNYDGIIWQENETQYF